MSEARTLDAVLPVAGRGQVGTAWWGMVCLIATEGILFAYLIFSYAYLGSQQPGPWPPAGPPSLRLALPATLLLLASSFAMEWGKRGAGRGARARGIAGFSLALGLGTAFVALEWLEWKGKHFDIAKDSYNAIYFLLTGTHLLHVLLGLAAIAFVLLLSLAGRIGRDHHQHRAIATLYWHFVDAVWLFVFATVYLSPRLT
jgi:heme/copper-type cytochrome/quinol oxidase subunit 3